MIAARQTIRSLGLLGCLLLAAACAGRPADPAPPAIAAATETPAPTLTPQPSPTAVRPATLTPQPTDTPSPTATSTASATPSITPTPFPTEPVVDRACPDPAPLKPVYERRATGDGRWPTPNPSTEPHFWFGHPFEGGDRLLISSTFPYGSDGGGRLLLHTGVDLAEPLGTPVLAVADGLVVVSQPDADELYGWRCDWYGELVVIRLDREWDGQPVYALYGHILNRTVEAGQRVTRGQPVAEVGVGGAATHPHLHLEVRLEENTFGGTRNPLLWLEPGRERGVIAGRLLDPDGRPWQGVGVSIAGGPSGDLHNTWTYLGDPQRLANPDAGWSENFVFGDVAAGSYRLETRVQGQIYSTMIDVAAGEVTAVEITTLPYRTATPQPSPSPTP